MLSLWASPPVLCPRRRRSRILSSRLALRGLVLGLGLSVNAVAPGAIHVGRMAAACFRPTVSSGNGSMENLDSLMMGRRR